jgi:hypothetical protein
MRPSLDRERAHSSRAGRRVLACPSIFARTQTRGRKNLHDRDLRPLTLDGLGRGSGGRPDREGRRIVAHLPT